MVHHIWGRQAAGSERTAARGEPSPHCGSIEVPCRGASCGYDGSIEEEESENKYMVIGFDKELNPIEVMYNVINENTINVFHAMRLRKKYFHYIKTRGEKNG